MKNIKTFCIDLDGTVYINGKLYPEAKETIKKLKEKYNVVFVSNTTTALFEDLLQKLNSYGFDITEKHLYTPAKTAKKIMEKNNHNSGIIIVPENTRKDFEWFNYDENGNTVLVATEGMDLKFSELKKPFNMLLKENSKFYTLQKNRFYKSNDGYELDMGAIVAPLEYASEKEAVILGKPSETLFSLIAEENNCKIDEMAMVGDDIEFDILIPMKLGLTGFLVKTGKYRDETARKVKEKYKMSPDYVIEDISKILYG
ncbi:MAG: HAD-IIA family hydrolase [Candidatus Muiribacteriota bacterium]